MFMVGTISYNDGVESVKKGGSSVQQRIACLDNVAKISNTVFGDPRIRAGAIR